MISVRRTKDLPTASFRFHLTMDTLAVQLYISHYLGMFRTFTCESAPMARKRNVRRKAHMEKRYANSYHCIPLLFYPRFVDHAEQSHTLVASPS